MNSFENELKNLINKYNLESDSNTPDFILAAYLQSCLDAYNKACIASDEWYKG